MIFRFLLLIFAGSSAIALQESDKNNVIVDEAYKMKIETPRLQYMMELQSTFADQSGKPKVENLAAYPTSVFCLPDYDIVHHYLRNEAEPQSSCSSIYSFLFEWESGKEKRKLPLAKACIRVYKNVIYRFMPKEQNVTVNISIKFTSTDNGKGMLLPLYFSEVWYFLKTIEVSVDSDSWLELDITKVLDMGWNPTLKSSTIDVALKFDVDCSQQRNVPLKIVNPATVEGLARRERQLAFQPFLVVYINDVQIKKVIQEQEFLFGFMPSLMGDQSSRNERGLYDEPACHVGNFTVTFYDLELYSVIYPTSVNIRNCIGSCSVYHTLIYAYLTTSHARLMISAHQRRLPKSHPYDMEPLLPCCSPVAYSPIYLIVIIGRVLESRLFPDFIVEKCGCK